MRFDSIKEADSVVALVNQHQYIQIVDTHSSSPTKVIIDGSGMIKWSVLATHKACSGIIHMKRIASIQANIAIQVDAKGLGGDGEFDGGDALLVIQTPHRDASLIHH